MAQMAREFVKLKLSIRREPDPPAPTMARMAPPNSVSASSSSQNLSQTQQLKQQQSDQQSQRGPSRAVSPGRGDSTDGDAVSFAAGLTSRKPSSACSEQRTNVSLSSAVASSPLASPLNIRRPRVPFDPTAAAARTAGGGQQGEILSSGGNGNTAAGQNTLDHFISGALSLFGKRK